MKRATDAQFDELHSLVTTEFLARIKAGEATTADLKAAADWLHKNDITGVALEGSPLKNLASLMPKVDFEAVQKAIKESQRKQAANLFASTPPSDMSEVGRRTDNTLLDVLYPSPPVDPASDPRGPFPTDVVTPFEPLPTNIPTSAEGADMDLLSGGELQFGLAPGESEQMANRVNRGGIRGLFDILVGDRLGVYGQLANVGLKGAQNLGRDVSDLFKGDFRFGPPQQNLGGGGGGGAMMPPMMQDPCPEGYKLIGGKCEPVDDVTQPIATTPAPMSAPLPQFEQKTQYTPVAPINPFILDPKRR